MLADIVLEVSMVETYCPQYKVVEFDVPYGVAELDQT